MSDDCSADWRGDILKAHRLVPSDLTGQQIPPYADAALFKTDWERWREYPQIDYRADVSKLYKSEEMFKALEEHPCAVREREANLRRAAEARGASYPVMFYVGLGMAGLGVLLSFRRKK